MKNGLKTVVNDVFAEYSKLMSESGYFENLAPDYVKLMEAIKTQKNELDKLQNKITELEKFKARYDKWIKDNVQDAEVIN